MPAESEAQRGLMGMALAVKRGDRKLSELPPAMQKKVGKIVDSMSEEQLADYTRKPGRAVKKSFGRQAKMLRQTDEELVLAKPMEDGSLALGLFNLGEVERQMAVSWPELEIQDEQTARDLWRQKDLGRFDGQFSATVARHGVVLVRLRPGRSIADN